MKRCHRCGNSWNGFRGEPRTREVCEGCGAYLHCCLNCHHFDSLTTNSCKLPTTSFIGSRSSLNYCDEFQMLNALARAREEKVVRAKATWNDLFKP